MAPLFTLGRKRDGRLGKVLRGSLALLAGGTLITGLVGGGEANAYVVKKTSYGDLIHWEQRSIDYTIDPSLEANVGGAADATRRAMDSWSGTVGAPDLQAIAVLDADGKLLAGEQIDGAPGIHLSATSGGRTINASLGRQAQLGLFEHDLQSALRAMV